MNFSPGRREPEPLQRRTVVLASYLRGLLRELGFRKENSGRDGPEWNQARRNNTHEPFCKQDNYPKNLKEPFLKRIGKFLVLCKKHHP